jgi:hypothetical protein
MSMLALNQVLLLYTWFALAGVLFFFLLIARLYQQFSGERTFYRLFIAPLILFGLAVVRYNSIDQVTHDVPGSALAALAGLLLIGLCARLYHQMTSGRS